MDLTALASVGVLVLRLAIGVGIMSHGYNALFYTEDGTAALAKMLDEKLKMPQPVLMAAIAKWTELVAGALLVLGLLTRLSALALTSNMLVAVYVHAIVLKDPFIRMGGAEGSSWELALLYLAGAVALLALGGGRFSVDEIAFGGHDETPQKKPKT